MLKIIKNYWHILLLSCIGAFLFWWAYSPKPQNIDIPIEYDETNFNMDRYRKPIDGYGQKSISVQIEGPKYFREKLSKNPSFKAVVYLANYSPLQRDLPVQISIMDNILQNRIKISKTIETIRVNVEEWENNQVISITLPIDELELHNQEYEFSTPRTCTIDPPNIHIQGPKDSENLRRLINQGLSLEPTQIRELDEIYCAESLLNSQFETEFSSYKELLSSISFEKEQYHCFRISDINLLFPNKEKKDRFLLNLVHFPTDPIEGYILYNSELPQGLNFVKDFVKQHPLTIEDPKGEFFTLIVRCAIVRKQKTIDQNIKPIVTSSTDPGNNSSIPLNTGPIVEKNIALKQYNIPEPFQPLDCALCYSKDNRWYISKVTVAINNDKYGTAIHEIIRDKGIKNPFSVFILNAEVYQDQKGKFTFGVTPDKDLARIFNQKYPTTSIDELIQLGQIALDPPSVSVDFSNQNIIPPPSQPPTPSDAPNPSQNIHEPTSREVVPTTVVPTSPWKSGNSGNNTGQDIFDRSN